MNKFRARQLDASKLINIYIEGETPEIADYNNATNRNVPQLPTGMEKEEETEHHLQQAIFHQRVIPVPEVFDCTQNKLLVEQYDKMYPPNFKLCRSMIHIHPFEIDNDIPDYDIDSDDESWLEDKKTKFGLIPLDYIQFEEMMDRLEKASGLKAVTLHEAKVLLKDDDDLITAVYDHWLNKRLQLQRPLMPQVVKAEKCIGSSPTDPYVAFRKRTEKMQTRKNRKNDEVSYEKMLKLQRDLSKAAKLIEMLAQREMEKTKLLKLNFAIYEKRYKLDDFCGSLIKEMIASRPTTAVVRAPLLNHQLSGLNSDMDRQLWRKVAAGAKNKRKNETKERRPYRKKRKVDTSLISSQNVQYNNTSDPFSVLYNQEGPSSVGVSEDELISHSEGEDDSNLDGAFTFRRKPNVTYLAPKEPFLPNEEDSISDFHGGDSSKRFNLTSVSRPATNCIGFARRRVGRGGRVWLDRINMPKLKEGQSEDFLSDNKKWPHFHPISPVSVSESEDIDRKIISSPMVKSQESPSSFIISAEVTEGRYAGSCSQVEVMVPAGLGASETVLESNGIPEQSSQFETIKSSRFCIWDGFSGCSQIVLKSVDSCSQSDETAGSLILSSSCVNNSFSSSLGSQVLKMAATSSCTLSTSSPAANSWSRISLKNNISSEPVKGTSKKSHHTPLFIQRQNKDGSSLDTVQICNNSVILNSKNNNESILNSGLVSKVLTSWNNDSSREDSASAVIINGPKTKRTNPLVFPEVENL